MDSINMPHKVAVEVATYQGDWTAEQIAAGLAGEPRIERQEVWYEPGPPGSDGPVEVTDPARIAALDARISSTDQKDQKE